MIVSVGKMVNRLVSYVGKSISSIKNTSFLVTITKATTPGGLFALACVHMQVCVCVCMNMRAHVCTWHARVRAWEGVIMVI